MLKKLSFLFLLLFLLLPLDTLAASSRVFDDASLFSEEEINNLSEEIQRLQDKTQMDYVVITTFNADGKTSRAYADDFYDSHDFGMDEEHSGMLYLIDLDNQEIYISTEGKMLRYLTDARIESLLGDAFIHAAEENYADSAFSVLEGVEDYIALGIPDGQYNYSSENGAHDPYQKSRLPLVLLIGVIGGLIASLSTFFGVKSRYNLTHETYHYPLHEKSSLRLTHSEDRLINQTLTHRKIPKASSPSSSSSNRRTTTHRSSSGRTHGGGGRSLR